MPFAAVEVAPPEPETGSGKFIFPDLSVYGKPCCTVAPSPLAAQTERECHTAEGEWSTGSDGVMKRHGVGTYKSGDNEYVGDWKDDAMDGQGKFTFASGAIYEVTS